MSIKVDCFDEQSANKALKDCPKIVRDYVKALKASLQRQKQVTEMAIKKIRELSKNHNQ